MIPISKRISHLSKEPVGKKAERAAEIVLRRRPFIRQFSDLEDLVLRGPEVDANAAAAAEHNLRIVRAELARILWKNDVFIGVDVIDRILFGLVHSGNGTDIVSEFLAWVQHRGFHRAGFLVYPLHSFGIQGLGFYSALKKSLPHLTLGDAGLAITAQTNNKEKTSAFLNHVRDAFDIKQKIPADLIEHFRKSRQLEWIDCNPLLALRVRSFTGTYYENQFIYMLKLRMSTALVMMLSVMEKPVPEDKRLIHGSSAHVNNWQTLDIRHYLSFEAAVGRASELTAYCIPTFPSKLELALLSDLNVDIDPRVWSKPRATKRLAGLHGTLTVIERGYLNNVILGVRDSLQSRVYRKLITSIDYFRRSFSAGVRDSEAAIALAIAFETLLTDHYALKSTERILRRVRICLRGVNGTRRLRGAVGQLFDCRGAIVHQGSAPAFSELEMARRAYVYCIQHVVSRLPHLPRESGKPIADILGDN